MSSLKDRIIRAAKLDVHLYEEVEADAGAFGQAMLIVILSSLAAGIGTFRYAGLKRHADWDNRSTCRVVYMGIFNLLYWHKASSGATDQCYARRIVTYHWLFKLTRNNSCVRHYSLDCRICNVRRIRMDACSHGRCG